MTFSFAQSSELQVIQPKANTRDAAYRLDSLMRGYGISRPMADVDSPKQNNDFAFEAPQLQVITVHGGLSHGLTPRSSAATMLSVMRHALLEAANAHLRRSRKWSVLRAWGVKLVKRVGARKACVAVARKLALLWQNVDFAAFYRIPESIFQ